MRTIRTLSLIKILLFLNSKSVLEKFSMLGKVKPCNLITILIDVYASPFIFGYLGLEKNQRKVR